MRAKEAELREAATVGRAGANPNLRAAAGPHDRGRRARGVMDGDEFRARRGPRRRSRR